MRRIALLVVLLAGCGTTDPVESISIQVQGTVRLASDGAAIAGATVGASWEPCPSGPFQHCFPNPSYTPWDPDVEVSSDAGGHYSFSYQVPGPFSVSELPVGVSCGGFQELDRTAGGLRYTEEVQTIDFQLEPTFPQAELYSVWGTSSDDIYVVGGAELISRTGAIGHYDGANWSAMLNRTSDGRAVLCGVADGLSDVWGTSSSDIFAVAGLAIVHYDGTSWHTMMDWPSPTGPVPAVSGLGVSVWGLSSTDVYAVGETHILHYDGTSWSTMADSSGWGLSDVWGAAAEDIYAVGNRVLHYDGTTWTVMLGGTESTLNAVWGTSSSDVFAVGYGFVTSSSIAGLILHYDGAEWNAMTAGTDVDLMDLDLTDVWGSSSTDIFAVGYQTILHYDGESWNTMADSSAWGLSGVWGTASNDVYAVGTDWSSGTVGLILHYDGSEWTRMPLH